MSEPKRTTEKAEYYSEFEEATRGLRFTKDFNASLEAIMHDKLAPVGQRVLAWIKRRSWGNYRTFCVLESDGVQPAFQRDICVELGLEKSNVSRTISYLRRRGYIRLQRKLIIPITAPGLEAPPDKATNPYAYATFREEWKVANSAKFQEREVARAIVRQIDEVILSDFKKWRTAKRAGAASLLQIVRPPEPETPPDRGVPPQETAAAAAPSETPAAAESILVALQQHGTTSLSEAKRLFKECRKAKPDCAIAEIIEVIGEITFGKNAPPNRIGILMNQVPAAVAARKKPPEDLNDLRRSMRSSELPLRIDAARRMLAAREATTQDRLEATEILSP